VNQFGRVFHIDRPQITQISQIAKPQRVHTHVQPRS
jgi:hypothetical protein